MRKGLIALPITFLLLTSCGLVQTPSQPGSSSQSSLTIPAAQKKAGLRALSAETQVSRLEVYPQNIVLATQKTASFYVKAYGPADEDLGIVDPSLLTVTPEAGIESGISFRDSSIVDVNLPAGAQSSTYSIQLRSRPEVQSFASVEVWNPAPDVLVIPSEAVKFPTSNIDPGILTDADMASSVAPFTPEELAAAFDSAEASSVPTFPVVLRDQAGMTIGSRLFLPETTGLFGKVVDLRARRDGHVLLLLEFGQPQDFFPDFTQLNYRSGMLWEDAVSVNQTPPPSTGTLSAQSATLTPQANIGRFTCTGDHAQFLSLNVSAGIGMPTLVQEASSTGPKTTFQFEPKLTYAATLAPGAAGVDVTCVQPGAPKVSYPLPGLLGVMMHLDVESQLMVRAAAKASVGLTMSKTHSVNVSTPYFSISNPKTNIQMGFPSSGDLFDVNGPHAKSDLSLAIEPSVVVKFVPGPARITLSLFRKYSTWLKRTRNLNLDQYGVGQLTLGLQGKLSGSVLSMRSAFDEQGTPSASASLNLFSEFGLTDWVWTTLTRFGIEPFKATGSIELMKATTTVPQLNDVAVTDNRGSATVGLTWADGSSVSRAQLASAPVNSLHADALSSSGGTTSYDLNQCTGAARLKASVMGVGRMKMGQISFGSDLPFWTGKEVAVCTTNIGITALANGSASSANALSGGRVKLTYALSGTTLDEGATFKTNYGDIVRDAGVWYYQAPLANSAGQTATITATSVGDPTKTDTIPISITPMSVTVLGNNSINSANALSGGRVKLSHVLNGAATPQAVKYSTNYGSIVEETGEWYYQAPLANSAGQTATVRVEVLSDPTKSDTIPISITPMSVTVLGNNSINSANALSGGTVQLSYVINGATVNQGVNYYTNYGTIITIGSSSYYQAPLANSAGQTATVTAVSVDDPTKSDTIPISITPMSVTVLGNNSINSANALSGGRVKLSYVINGAATPQAVKYTTDYGSIVEEAGAWYYQAPLANSAGQTATVRVEVLSDPTKSDTIPISITPMSVTVLGNNSINSANALSGGRVKLSYVVNGAATTQAVRYTTDRGSIVEEAGEWYYQARLDNSAGQTATVRVEVLSDSTKTDTIPISITPISVTALGNNAISSANALSGGTVQLSYVLNGAALDQGVTWSGGNITTDALGKGIYTAPVLACGTSQQFTLTATSISDPSKFDSIPIYVSGPSCR